MVLDQGPGPIGEFAVRSFRLALSAALMVLFVERKGDRLGLRFLDSLDRVELDENYENIAAGVLTVLLLLFSVDIVFSISNLVLGTSTWLIVYTWVSTFSLPSMAVSLPAIAAVIYYYAHDNQRLYDKLAEARRRIRNYS